MPWRFHQKKQNPAIAYLKGPMMTKNTYKQKKKSLNEGSVSENIKHQDTLDQWMMDLENIFQKAMDGDKLNIALKAKELLAKNQGWIAGGVASTPRTIKSIDQWTLQEVQDMILQLDAYQNTETESTGCKKKEISENFSKNALITHPSECID